MKLIKTIDGNEACARTSYMFTELAGIYPITPSSPMAEHIDEWSSNGKLNIFNDKTELVFNESLSYTSEEKYLDGVKLELNSNLVSVNKSGVVVYIGEKEGYGNTIIIQRVDGVDEWYGGILNTSLKLYDYVYEDSLLGEVDKYLYLVYKKDGNTLNYEEYIK